MERSHETLVGLGAVTFFTLLAGDFWRYLLSWYGWGAIVLAIAIAWGVVGYRYRVSLTRVPVALLAFAILMTASIAWSAYPTASVIGVSLSLLSVVGATIIAKTLDAGGLLRALGVALRWILGLSLVFEFLVEVFWGRPMLPFWVSYEEPIPRAFYWSRSLLFDGGRIQGIAGNANLLGTAALIALIVFSVQLASRRVTRFTGVSWIVVAGASFVLSGSGTGIAMAIGVVGALIVMLLARRTSGSGRRLVYGVAFLVSVVGLTLILAFRGPLLTLLGRSSDLTFRVDIWSSVWLLITERPVLGWGWVSYWAPWVEPFTDLAVFRGVRYLQAHNAWLDVTLQIGVVGLVIFAVLALSTFARVWSWALDPALSGPVVPATVRLYPALILTALLVQSLAESRILIEFGFVFLVICAVASRAYSGWFERAPGRTFATSTASHRSSRPPRAP